LPLFEGHPFGSLSLTWFRDDTRHGTKWNQWNQALSGGYGMADYEWRTTWPVQGKALDGSTVSVIMGLLERPDGTWLGISIGGGDPIILPIKEAIDLSMAVRDAIAERYRISNHESGAS
jgi:hypothetical protein